MSNYKVKAWSWCADYCKKNHWNPHDSYFWDKAMLEYRRENNIFEYGDKIIDSLMGNSVIVFLEFHENIGDGYIKSFVRHATDAEIKAGRRL